MVRETRLAPEMSINSAQGILTAKKAHGGLAIQSVHVWSQLCGVGSARFVTCFTHVRFRHGTRYIHDHVIVSFDIIVD